MGTSERGGLLFEPRQLHQLPEPLREKVRTLTAAPTLVVGYSGQDHGIMSALCAEPQYNAFWSSPRPLTYDEEYHYAAVLDWMQSRNSRSNFLYGDLLGRFDDLFQCLEQDLNQSSGIRGKQPDPIGRENFILAALRSSPRLFEVHNDARRVITAEYERLPANAPPFAAPSAADARLMLEDCLGSDLVSAVVRSALNNEMEALALALACEISSHLGLGSGIAKDFARLCQVAYDKSHRSVRIGATIWDLAAALCDDDDLTASPAELCIHFNGKTQLTLLGGSARPAMLKAALRLVHGLGWLAKGEIAPALLGTEFGDGLTSLRDKVREASARSGKVVVLTDSLNGEEVAILRSQIPGLAPISALEAQPFVLAAGALRIEAECLREGPSRAPDEGSDLLNQIDDAASASVRNFLAIPDPYGALFRDSVPTSLDHCLVDFASSDLWGLMIVGESGTGKSSAIRRFVRRCDDRDDCRVIVRTPRMAGLSPSFQGLFLPFLLGSSAKERLRALAALDASLARWGQNLYLVLDGLNEFEGDFEAVAALYRDLLEFNAILAAAGVTRIRSITTVRTHFFVQLCLSCSPPPPAHFYSPGEGDASESDAAFVRVSPLSLEEIDGIARLSFGVDVASAFLELIRNVPRLAKDYAHPVLLAVAGQVIETVEEVGSLRRSATLFQRFADRMLERLGDADQQHRAIETLHAYFEIQIHQSSAGVITEFALSRGLGRAASEIIRQIADARIFRISPRGTVSFSHDRIAEHFLGHYLLHNLHRPVVIASVFRRTIANAVFFGGLRSLVSRLLAGGVFEDDAECLVHLHAILRDNILAEGGPTSELVLEALCDFERRDAVLDRLDKSAPDISEFRRLLAHGLWRVGEGHAAGEVLDHISVFCDSLSRSDPALSELSCAAAHAALSDSTDATGGAVAEHYLSFVKSGALQEAGTIWQDRYRIVRAKLARQRGRIRVAIDELSDLYNSQIDQAAWTHAAATALELGRAYRDNTQLREALDVYQRLSDHVDQLSKPVAARLALQTATVEKNLLQELVRSKSNRHEALCHYESALRHIDLARQYAHNARLSNIEVETSVERLELLLAAGGVVNAWLQLAREASLEVERLLSFHPNHRQLVSFRRQQAKIAAFEGRHGEAIAILQQARALAQNTNAHFYATDCDYQLGHMIAQVPDLARDARHRATGIAALSRAIDFYENNCAPDIEYKRHCVEALEQLSGELD
jgi:tetratricopeptide (TPR) repeat protein